MKKIIFSFLGCILIGNGALWGEEIVAPTKEPNNLVPSLEAKAISDYRVLPYAQLCLLGPGVGVSLRNNSIQYDANAAYFSESNGESFSVEASASRIYFPYKNGFNIGAGFGIGGFGLLPGMVIPLIGAPVFIGYEGNKAFISFNVLVAVTPIIFPFPALKAGVSF